MISDRLQQIHRHSRLNRQFMSTGTPCRCFHCRATFPAEAIGQWIDAGATAICPCCGIDAVLSSGSDALSDALIGELHAAYFDASRKFTEEEWRGARRSG